MLLHLLLYTRACKDKRHLRHHAEVILPLEFDRNGTTPTAAPTGKDSSAGAEETAAAAISMLQVHAVSTDNFPVKQHDFTAAYVSKPPIISLRIPSAATDGI